LSHGSGGSRVKKCDALSSLLGRLIRTLSLQTEEATGTELQTLYKSHPVSYLLIFDAKVHPKRLVPESILL